MATRAENNYSLPFFLYAQTCIPSVSFVEIFRSEDDDTQFLSLRSVAQGDEHRAKVLSHLQQGRKAFIGLARPTVQFLIVYKLESENKAHYPRATVLTRNKSA